MPWKRSVLVVANVTAASDRLLEALQERAARDPASFTLVIPATPFGGGRAAAEDMLRDALGKLRDGGLEADGAVGDSDPIVAVTEAWDPRRYDEIIVSTLPMRVSKWLHAGLPERIGKLTGAPVTHVASAPPKPAPARAPARTHDEHGAPLGPLSVLAWGANKPQ